MATSINFKLNEDTLANAKASLADKKILLLSDDSEGLAVRNGDNIYFPVSNRYWDISLGSMVYQDATFQNIILTQGFSIGDAPDGLLFTTAGVVSNASAAQIEAAHTHSKLIASDGSPDPALSVDASGNVVIPTGNSLGLGAGKGRMVFVDGEGIDELKTYNLGHILFDDYMVIESTAGTIGIGGILSTAIGTQIGIEKDLCFGTGVVIGTDLTMGSGNDIVMNTGKITTVSSSTLEIAPGGGAEVLIAAGLIVNNTAGATGDLQVKGDTDDNLVYADVSADRVGIGTATPTEKLDVNGGIRSINTAANGVGLLLTDSNTNAANKMGRINLQHYLNAEESITLLQGVSESDQTRIYIGGAETAHNTATSIIFRVSTDNVSVTGTEVFLITAASGIFTQNKSFTINASSGDYDTQIKGDTDANLIYVDASTDRVGIGTATPAAKLDVVGTVQCDALRIDQTPTSGTIVPDKYITVDLNGVSYKIACVAA